MRRHTRSQWRRSRFRPLVAVDDFGEHFLATVLDALETKEHLAAGRWQHWVGRLGAVDAAEAAGGRQCWCCWAILVFTALAIHGHQKRHLLLDKDSGLLVHGSRGCGGGEHGVRDVLRLVQHLRSGRGRARVDDVGRHGLRKVVDLVLLGHVRVLVVVLGLLGLGLVIVEGRLERGLNHVLVFHCVGRLETLG